MPTQGRDDDDGDDNDDDDDDEQQWLTERGVWGCSIPPSTPPPRNSEVLTKLNRIAN
jgi:hypothetical protein